MKGKFLPVLFVLIMILSAVGCTVQTTSDGYYYDPIVETETDNHGIGIVETADPTYPYVIFSEDTRETVIPRFPSYSETPDSFVYINEYNDRAHVWFNADGTTQKIVYDNDVIVLFENWTTTTVDFAVIDSDGDYTIFRNQSLPSRSMNSGGTSPRSFEDKNWMDLVSTGFATFACVTSIITAPAHFGLGTYIACGSFALNMATYFVPENFEAFTGIGSTAGAVVGTVISCSAHDYGDCAIGVAGLTVDATNALLDVLEAPVNAADGALSTGYGNVKVTLTWDTASDLDLYVTDPYDETIYYLNRNSDSGGYLDVDDMNGYGPENIYWETAPRGEYTVRVKHFSGTVPSRYEVYVESGSFNRRYSGTLTYSKQDNWICTFSY